MASRRMPSRKSATCSDRSATLAQNARNNTDGASARAIDANFAFYPNSSSISQLHRIPARRPGTRVKRSLLIRRSLGVCLVSIRLVRFVMTNNAASRSTELAVSRHVSGDATDDSPLNATLGVCCGRHSERNRGCASRCQNPFHERSPIGIQRIRTDSVPTRKGRRYSFRARREAEDW